MLANAIWEDPKNFSGPWNFGPDSKSIKTVKNILDAAESEWVGFSDWEYLESNQPYESSLLQLDSSKAKTKLGWKPLFDFNQSVSKTIRWYKEYHSSKVDMKEFTLGQIQDYEERYNHEI